MQAISFRPFSPVRQADVQPKFGNSNEVFMYRVMANLNQQTLPTLKQAYDLLMKSYNDGTLQFDEAKYPNSRDSFIGSMSAVQMQLGYKLPEAAQRNLRLALKNVPAFHDILGVTAAEKAEMSKDIRTEFRTVNGKTIIVRIDENGNESIIGAQG